MIDLLNEEDFFPKEHNPKRWFNIFYALSLAISTICFWGTRLLRDYLNENIKIVIIIAGLSIPLILSLLMVFLKRENILLLKTKKVAYAIAIVTFLSFCCLLSLTIDVTIKNNKYMDDIPLFFGAIILVYLGIYLLTIAIVIPILKRARRRNKLPQ
jgi:hypothetical protein